MTSRCVLCCWGHVMACDFIMSGTLPSSAASLWHGHSKLWMINCNEMKFLFAACSPRPRREKMSGREYFQCSAVAILVQYKKINLFVGVLHVTRFQQKRPWLNGRQDLSQTVDCRGCAVYWMSDIVWSASPPLIDQAGNFNLKQQSNYLKTSTNFRTRTFLFDLLNVTRTVYLQSTKKPKNRLKVRAKSTKIYLLPNQQCYDCL